MEDFGARDPGPGAIRWLPTRQLRRAVTDAILRHATRGGTVVDYGCGERPYQALFERKGMRYVGVDVEGNADLVVRPGDAIPLEAGSAALVGSFQVLEHVADVGHYLSECRRLLEPNGTLLLSTHGVWPYHPHPGDYTRWTGAGLEHAVARAGFVSLGATPILGPLAWSLMIQGMALNFAVERAGLPLALLAPFNLAVSGAMALGDRVTPSTIIRNNASVYVLEARPRA